MNTLTVYGSGGKKHEYLRLSEQDIKLQIYDWLKAHRIFVERQNVGGMKKGKHYIQFAKRGTPDLWCIVDGKYVGLEVKKPSGEQSRPQIEFEARVKAAKGYYFIVRSLDEAQLAIAEVRGAK